MSKNTAEAVQTGIGSIFNMMKGFNPTAKPMDDSEMLR